MSDEWIKEERDHEYRMASLKEDVDRRKREARTERIQAVTMGAVIVLIAGMIAGLIVFFNVRTSPGLQVEVACVESGGTWASINDSPRMCFHFAGGSNG